MSIFKRLFGIRVTKTKQSDQETTRLGKKELKFSKEKPTVEREYDFDPWNEMRIQVLQLACDEYELDLTTYERGQFLEIVFSHGFFQYFVKLQVAKTDPEEMKEKLKLYVLNRVLPEHQLN